MKRIIMLCMLMWGMQVPAQTDGQGTAGDSKTDDLTQAELLAEVTQPAEDATSVKVIIQKKQTIEEYRQRGELVLVKVIPNEGVPYFIDPLEGENLHGSGRDLINSGVKPVRWVLKEF